MPVVLKISGASKDTTVVIFDEGGTLSYAGGNYAPSAKVSQISYDLSFVATSIAFDVDNVTMATGSSAIFSTLDGEIENISSRKTADGNVIDLVLSKNADVEKVFLQKSYNGQDYTDMGEMFKKRNLFQAIYSFEDPDPSETRIFYRSKVILRSGAEKWSPIVIMRFDSRFSYMVTPNPAKDYLYITRSPHTVPGKLTANIFNLQGRKVLSQYWNTSIKDVRLNIRNLTHGTYIIQLNSESGEILLSDKFIITGN
jgi:hypothetical protein